jgi:hypothetical protein
MIFKWELQKWGLCCMKSSSFPCVVWSYLFLVIVFIGLSLFLRVGVVELCTITQNPKINTHSWIDISKTSIVGNPQQKVVNRPRCVDYVDYVTNFRVSINVVNGWAWAKATHQF